MRVCLEEQQAAAFFLTNLAEELLIILKVIKRKLRLSSTMNQQNTQKGQQQRQINKAKELAQLTRAGWKNQQPCSSTVRLWLLVLVMAICESFLPGQWASAARREEEEEIGRPVGQGEGPLAAAAHLRPGRTLARPR